MKALKTFIKPSEKPQRSVKTKTYDVFILIYLFGMKGAGRIKLWVPDISMPNLENPENVRVGGGALKSCLKLPVEEKMKTYINNPEVREILE